MINHEHQPYLSLRDSISGMLRPKIPKEVFWALNDISFQVGNGESIGIIGKNGAGKSTLLKILSKITPPSTGKITCRGRIASLLEVGTGFHPELTGRENAFMNGSILGMKRKEIEKNFDAIVDFAGVEKFIDTPLKHYSSGMQLRLAFAVAAFLENEILIIDEVLAVGDMEFQKKCIGKMEDVSKNYGRTVLFVSHNMQAVNLLCGRAIVLKNGLVDFDGATKTAIRNYNGESTDFQNQWQGDCGDRSLRLKKTWIKPSSQDFTTDSELEIGVEVELLENVTNLVLGFWLLSEFGETLAYCLNDDFIENPKSITEKGKWIKKFKIPPNTLAKGSYHIKFDIGIHNVKKIIDNDGCLEFSMINNGALGCRFPVIDGKGFSSIFRPNWAQNDNN
jgi:lipopolysaccharide transport system ATP-binding protein